MKTPLANRVCIISLASLFLLPQVSFAQYHFELTPGLIVSQVYDDNLYLDSTNEESDYVITVSPSLSLNLLSENTHLQVQYAPTLVRYGKEEENDTVRHSGSMTFGQNVTEYLTFDVNDTYVKSEEPIEEAEDVENIRHTRDTYQRNTGSASLSYLFGPEDVLTVGYRHSLLKNEDVAVDDGKIRNPFSTVTYWFNEKNGLELDYEYTMAVFWRGDDSDAGDDYAGHRAGIRHIHRFTPHALGSLSYHFTNRNFDGGTEDYQVHEGSIGFERAFSHDLSISVGCGYFVQQNEQSDDQTGYSYDALVAKSFERGSFTIGGSGGWDEAYLEAERRGFSRYQSIETRLQYQIMEPLNGYVNWSYRLDKGENNRQWGTWGRACGLRWTCLRWLSLSLDYTFANRDDDVDAEDYRVHRVTLVFTASSPYRW